MKDELDLILDFYPKIYFACHTRHVTDKEEGVKLTSNQVSVLDHLDYDEPMTVFDLAMHMGVTPSTMSITLNRLEEMGYVVKQRDKKDSRKVNIRLSAAGVRIKKSKSVLDPVRVEALLKRLSDEEREVALKGLGFLAYAAELEMKNMSLSNSWAKNRNKNK